MQYCYERRCHVYTPSQSVTPSYTSIPIRTWLCWCGNVRYGYGLVNRLTCETRTRPCLWRRCPVPSTAEERRDTSGHAIGDIWLKQDATASFTQCREPIGH